MKTAGPKLFQPDRQFTAWLGLTSKAFRPPAARVGAEAAAERLNTAARRFHYGQNASEPWALSNWTSFANALSPARVITPSRIILTRAAIILLRSRILIVVDRDPRRSSRTNSGAASSCWIGRAAICGAGHSEPPRYPQPIYPFPLTLPACMAVSAASSSFSATVSHVKYRAHAR